MAPEVREFLTAEFGPEGLPFNTFYGDGTPLDRATVDLVNEVYERHTVREPWRRGDLLVVDNVRTAHSREPYRGSGRSSSASANRSVPDRPHAEGPHPVSGCGPSSCVAPRTVSRSSACGTR